MDTAFKLTAAGEGTAQHHDTRAAPGGTPAAHI